MPWIKTDHFYDYKDDYDEIASILFSFFIKKNNLKNCYHIYVIIMIEKVSVHR